MGVPGAEAVVRCLETVVTVTGETHMQKTLLVRFAAFSLVLGLSGCTEPQYAVAEPAETTVIVTRNTTPVDQTPDPNRLLKASDLKSLSWRSIGPANMSGRVAAIAQVPGTSKSFFVGFGTGGLFKTDNHGTTFAALFEKEATASIGSVAVCKAASDEKKDGEDEKLIVWVGTGEGNGRNSSSWGAGVYRSTDGGGTWECVGLKDSHDIPQLAVDPRNPDVCYVAALGHLWGPNEERGVYKTEDAGKTWTPVLQIDENTGACDVRIDPQSPDTVYAAMYMRRRTAWSMMSGGPEGGIYKSTDAGATWKKLGGGLPTQTGRIGLDIYLKDPKVLFAVVESDVGGSGVDIFDNRQTSGGLFRSEDGGENWTRVSELNFRPFYFSKVRVDPVDDNRVYMLGWGLAISDDGGRNFRAGGAKLPHGDMHELVVDPADHEHLLMGTDGGVYSSFDRAKSWVFHNNIAAGEFYNIAFDMSDPYRVGGGLQDNCTWIGPSATIMSSGSSEVAAAEGVTEGGITNSDWRLLWGGDGYHVAFDPTDRNIVYGEWQGGEVGRIHLDTGFRKRIKPSPKEGQERFRFNWNSPFFISPHNPTTLYLGGNHVFKLTDRGDRWEMISPDLSTRDIEKIMTVGSEAETHGTVVSLAESPLAAGVLWAGTDDGRVHVTQNDGGSWQDVTPPQTEGMYISRIEASHHDRDTAYVSIEGHRSNRFLPVLVVTTDSGKTWTQITGEGDGALPADEVVKVVREDRKNADVLYIGTERAMFVSIDRGGHWVKLNADSLPTVAVDDIQQHPREMDLIAGTHGRSIYILDDATPLSQLTPDIVRSEFHLFESKTGRPQYYLPYEGLWGDQIFRAPNPPKGVQISYWVRDFNHEAVKITIADSAGNTVRALSGSSAPGIQRVLWDLQPEKHDRLETPDTGLGILHFVPPGDYKVTATFGEAKSEIAIKVLPPPGK